jgi:hypothetical protein
VIVTDLAGERPVVWEWLHQRTAIPWATDLRVIAWMSPADGTITMATAFEGFFPGGCFMHTAADRPLVRSYVQAVFGYGFDHCSNLYGITPNKFPKAHALNTRLGFCKIANVGDAVLYGMHYSQCRWLKDAALKEAA